MSPVFDRFGGTFNPYRGLVRSLQNPSTARLRSASAHVLNSNYKTQPDDPGFVQEFPASSAACTALGWPAPTALWLCDEAAGNLVDKIAAAALVPTAAPLQNRIVNGVAGGVSLWSKVCVETATINERFLSSSATLLNVGDGVDFTLSLALRPRPVNRGAAEIILCRRNAAGSRGYQIDDLLGVLDLLILDPTGSSTIPLGATMPYDGALHLLTIAVDRNGNLNTYLDSLATATVAAARPGDLAGADGGFTLLNYTTGGFAFNGQCAWCLVAIGTAAARAAHDATWRHMQAAGLGFPNTMTRATTCVVPISATQTACSASGQVAVGYAVGAVAAARGNALGLGQVFENATAFMPIASNNLPGYGLNWATLTPVDGVNAMRSGIRVNMLIAWVLGNYGASCALALVGAPSNDTYAFGGWVKRGTVGTSGRAAWSQLTGGVLEMVDIWTSAAVPIGETYITGTFAMANAGNTRGYLSLGAALNGDNCEFSDWWVVKGTTVIPLAYKYCAGGVVAAETMACPVELIDNTLGQRFTPAEGTIEIEIAGFAGAFSAGVPADLFHAVPAAGDAGRLYWRLTFAGTVEIRAYDAAGAVAWTMTTALVPDAGYHKYRLSWNASNPVYNFLGISYYACLEEITAAHPAGVVLDFAGAADYTTPLPTTVPNLYVGSNAGTMAARCIISSLELR
jgi:hypothetical protein